MTTVNLKYRKIDGANPDGVLVTSGLVEVTPAYRSDTGSGQMTTITDTFPVGASITLAGGTYLFKLRASDGHGGRLKDEGVYRLVPASGTFDVDDLTEVIPTVGSVTQSDVAAMIAAAIAGIVVGPGGTPTGSGPGGAFVSVDVTDTTDVGRSVMTAAGASTAARQAAARTAIGAGTSNLAIGTSSTTAKAGDYQPASTNISDSTTVGRSVLTAVDAAAARSAIGAGAGGGVALGTTAGTAAEATTVVLLTGNQTKAGVLTTSSEQVIQTATASTSPLRKDQFDAYHSPCFLVINYSTGVWPTRVVPSGASFALWWSAGYPNASAPPGAVDGDFWAENYPT